MIGVKRLGGTKPIRISPRIFWLVWYASALHILWGVLLLLPNGASEGTPLSTIIGGLPYGLRSGVLIGIGGLAVLPFFLSNRHWWHIVWMAPQQTLLLLSAAASVGAVVSGHYADGTVRPWGFILGDQLPNILLAKIHLVASIDFAQRHYLLRLADRAMDEIVRDGTLSADSLDTLKRSNLWHGTK